MKLIKQIFEAKSIIFIGSCLSNFVACCINYKHYTTLVFSLFAALIIIINPLNMRHDYGDGKGKYDERGDSHVDYNARNSIKNEIFGYENKGLFPIFTKGYSVKDKNGVLDYNYYPDNTWKTYTGNYLHVFLFAKLAKIMQLDTMQSVDKYIFILRFFNAFFFCLCLFKFISTSSTMIGLNLKLSSMLGFFVIISSWGFSLFSQNLYNSFWIFLLPLAVIPVGISKYSNTRKFFFLIFLLSCLNFARSFSQGPLYLVIVICVSLIFYPGACIEKLSIKHIKYIILVGCSVLLGLSFCLILYVFFYAYDHSFNLTFTELIKNAFAFLKLFGPADWRPETPLGISFVKTLFHRWQAPAFLCWPFGWAIKQYYIIILFVICLLLRIGKLTVLEFALYCWAFLGYTSLYIIGFHYTMQHIQYEWSLFALTFTISLIILSLYYIKQILNTVMSLNIFKQCSINQP